MVLVAFSQNVGSGGTSSGGGGTEEFEEQVRRLTVAPGPSEYPRVAFGAGGSLHVSWIDGRDGSVGVYAKSSRNGGLTFGGDRPLASGFRSVSGLSLAAGSQAGTVGVAWAGAAGSELSRVYVRTSSDDGRTWGRPAVVGPGESPSLALGTGQALLGYVHRNGTSPGQVRLVSLALAGGAIRGGRGLLAFNASASDVAVAVAGGSAHVVWADRVLGATVLVHVSVDLASGVPSQARVIATFRARLGGRLALVGQGTRLGLVWSDDASGTFDVRASMSADGGATWPVGGPVAEGPSNSVAPSAAHGGGGVLAVAWQDDRTGSWQVFGRLAGPGGALPAPARRVSASPVGATEPAVAFGSGRDAVVAWTDARHGDSEVYGDLDVLLDRPRAGTLGMYVKRLAAADFAPPARTSRAVLLGLIGKAGEIVERREEARAIAFLRDRVMTRFDGTLGGDPRDDLVVSGAAQLDLTRLARGLIELLKGSTGSGTRAGGGEPDPPPPGKGGDPPPEPVPAHGGTAGAKPTVSDVAFDNVTATQAVVSWRVTSPDVPIDSSFVDWGDASVTVNGFWFPQHRTWDNATPHVVPISPLVAGTTYKARAGARHGYQGAFTAWSDTYSLYVGVAITSLHVTNVCSSGTSLSSFQRYTHTVDW